MELLVGHSCSRSMMRTIGGELRTIHPARVARLSPLWSVKDQKRLVGKLRNELLDREVFYTLLEVKVLTEQ